MYSGAIHAHRHTWKYPGKIHGIAVCDDVSYFTTELKRIQQEFETRYNISLDLSNSEQVMDDNYVGTGYALNTEKELRTLIQLAETEGLVLDPVYTLKAFIGMIDHIQKGIIKPGEKVLFIHTGGHYGLFPKSDELGNVLEL